MFVAVSESQNVKTFAELWMHQCKIFCWVILGGAKALIQLHPLLRMLLCSALTWHPVDRIGSGRPLGFPELEHLLLKCVVPAVMTRTVALIVVGQDGWQAPEEGQGS